MTYLLGFDLCEVVHQLRFERALLRYQHGVPFTLHTE